MTTTLMKIARNRSLFNLTGYVRSSKLQAESTIHCKRFLFKESELMINEFVSQRSAVQDMYGDMLDKLKSDMELKLRNEDSNCVPELIMKNMIYSVNDDKKDLQLFRNTVERFVKFDKRQYLEHNFHLGPNIMRMYHKLNRPKEALEIYNSKNAQETFHNPTSHLILMDLLYKSALYQEILDLMDSYSQLEGMRNSHPRKLVFLTLMACLQLNTSASYQYGMKILKASTAYPSYMHIFIMMRLALYQNKPDQVFELFKMVKSADGKFTSNLKIMAYAQQNKLDDCFSALDACFQNRIYVYDDTVEEVSAAVGRNNDISLTHRFEQYLNSLKLSDLLSTSKIETIFMNSFNRIFSSSPRFRQQRQYLADNED